VLLNYSAANTVLFIDGELAASGDGLLAVPPSVAHLTLGSTYVGTESAQGEFEELHCLAHPLDAGFHYYPLKDLAARGPITEEEEMPGEDLEGGGALMRFAWNDPSVPCVTNGPVYLTNIVAAFDANYGWTVSFDIAGGTNGVPYDIFRTTE